MLQHQYDLQNPDHIEELIDKFQRYQSKKKECIDSCSINELLNTYYFITNLLMGKYSIEIMGTLVLCNLFITDELLRKLIVQRDKA